MIQIIDYGAGNLKSVANALEKLGFEYEIIDSPSAINDDAKIIFPGVGAAGSAMKKLRETGFDKVIPTLKQPFLGICLGMQLLTGYSEENFTDCLGVVEGEVKKFTCDLKIPQMGWNTVSQLADDPLFEGVPDDSYFYFVNSYYVDTPDALGRTKYGGSFVSVLKKDNFYGVQFHPEKSGEVGLRLLRNFCEYGVSLSQNSYFVGGVGLQPPCMKIYPAIDIIGGKCVRLTRGDYDKVKEYGADPLEVARNFKKGGAEMLHIVDLEGAKEGQLMNFDTISEINMPMQVGGGIRSYEDAKKLIDSGVARIIMSTSALENPDLVGRIVADFGPERIVISLDVKDGKIATRGWMEVSEMSIEDFLEKMRQIGIKILIITDVSRDGMLAGVDPDMILRFTGQLPRSGFEIIVAGGVSSVADIEKLRELGVDGAIIGKALYEGNLSLKACLGMNESVFCCRGGASMLAKRIIPCLDVRDGRLTKGVKFKNNVDIGDPVKAARNYYEQGADEIVFYDISASPRGNEIMLDVVERVAKEIFIPFSVGGGIRTVADMRRVLLAGAEKISVNSAAVKNPSIISEGARAFGSQCIVVGMDVRRTLDGFEVVINGGRTPMGIDALKWAQEVERLGAGEICLNSIDEDGVKGGYDLELVSLISRNVGIPVIASGGVGKLEDLIDGANAGADALLAASIFHYSEYSIKEAKEFLKFNNIIVR